MHLPASDRPWLRSLANVLLLDLLLATVSCSRTPELTPSSSGSPSTPTHAVPAPPDVKAPPEEATRTPSGLAYKVLVPGDGQEHPSGVAQATLNYTGWTSSGRMFFSTSTHKKPQIMRVDQVIKGWTEGLQLMTRGQKMRFWVPAALAYGDTPRRRSMPAGDLVFDVELVDFIDPPGPPPDVRAPPPSARHTDSGLAYRVLQKGTGKRHPQDTHRVLVVFTGWTTDGKAFDSSVFRNGDGGIGDEYAVNAGIAGWTEGLKLMVEGEKTRFWVPPQLAYGDAPPPGSPAGMLVFDVELRTIL